MTPALRSMSWNDLLQGLVVPQVDVQVHDLCLDSRQCRPGAVFVAMAGEQGHGLDYLDSALAGGAVGVIHDGARQIPADCSVPAIAVSDLALHLPELAQRFWGRLDELDLIAVTGTNGKTSVAWLLAQALDGFLFGTLGLGRPGELVSGTHTTPDVLSVYRGLASVREAGGTTVVLEASSHALAQGRLAGLSFTSVIFTGFGHDHLDYHRSIDDYFEAKAKLFTDFPAIRRIVNLDDPRGRELAARVADLGPSLGYSLSNRADAVARLEARQLDLAGLRAKVSLPEGDFEVRSRLIGRVNLHNLAIVVLELRARGLSFAEMATRIAALEPVPGRMQALTDRYRRQAVIDYAHTPDALERVLSSLRELGPQRIWCVFGCGGDRDRAKRPMMGRVAESFADHVVLTDDNPRSEDGTAIIRAIQAGMRHPERTRVIRDRSAAIRSALSESLPGDLVLVAGKGHETEQWVADRCLPHSDEAVVRQVLEEAA